MPPSLINAYKAGDYGKTSDVKTKAAKDIDRVYAQIKQYGDDAWATIEAGGQLIRVR
jgi:hypothetical protein